MVGSEGNRRRLQRSGPRSWPPKSHKYPVAFNAGQETTGLLKSIAVELLPFFDDRGSKRPGEFHWTCDQVREFDLSFYLPLDVLNRSERVRGDVVILSNGLNEINYINYAHYDRIGAFLSSRGITAILHPTPFHLNRTAFLGPEFRDEYLHDRRKERFPGTKDVRPLQRLPADATAVMNRLPHNSLLRRPEAMFYCFEQTARELINIASVLSGESNPDDEQDRLFFDRLFVRRPSDIRVTLLGYSLGGLQALYTFLRRPELFHRCILINSGTCLDRMTTKPVRISNDEWNHIVSGVYDAATNIPKVVSDPGLLNDILCHRPFKNSSVKQAFKDHASRIFFVAGGADIVSPGKQLSGLFLDSAEEGAGFGGLNILQIGDLEHPLQNSPVYDRWFHVLMDIVEAFVRSPRREKMVRYDKLLGEFGGIVVGKKSWATYVREHDGRADVTPYIDDGDHNLDVQRLLKHLQSSSDRNIFLKYYFTAKRFFENDADLVRAVDRARRGGASARS